MASQLPWSVGSTNPTEAWACTLSSAGIAAHPIKVELKYLPFSAIMFHKRGGSCRYNLKDQFSVGTLNFLLSGKWSARLWRLALLCVRNHPMAGTLKHRTSTWGVQDAPRTPNNRAGLQLLGLSVFKKSARNLRVPKLISRFLQQWKSK